MWGEGPGVAARPLGGEGRCLLVHLAGRAAGSRPQGPLTCHGRVAQEACDLLLTQLLLFIGQQLVEELPEHLLGRGVQNGVHVNNEGVDVPAGEGAEAGSSSLGGVDRVVAPGPGIQLTALTPTLKDREGREAVSGDRLLRFKCQTGLGMFAHWQSTYLV